MDSTTIVLRPGCKINLYLEIHCRRDDGYHELSTAFYPLAAPSDVLTFTPGEPGTGFVFTCSNTALEGPDNIVVKAYGAYSMEAGQAIDLAMHLEKEVPLGAGLGGGSADAAAMLTGLNTLAGAKALPPETLQALAVNLGADVAFFLQNEPCWAEGIGERLSPVTIEMEGLTLVLCCPTVPISTAGAYEAWDALQWKKQKGWQKILTACPHSRTSSFFTNAMVLFNSFEEVVLPMEPRLRHLKEQAYQHGACGALMSGSGSSIFALFRDPEEARAFADSVASSSFVGPDRVFRSRLL